MELCGEEFLRKLTYTDIEKLYARHDEKHRGDHEPNPFVLLEVISSQDLRIWHVFFGVSRMNNDVNILRKSPIFNDLKAGKALDVSFEANEVTYKREYYLTDEIYSKWFVLIKSMSNLWANDHKRIMYKMKHEASRNDVKRYFGVLKKKWAILKHTPQGISLHKITEIILSESRKVDCSFDAIFHAVSCFLPLRDTLLDSVGANMVANPDLPLQCYLDSSNPLHLHANDSNETPLISIKLTGVENYRVLASAIKLGLQTKNKMGFITGFVLKSDYVASNLLSEQWDIYNVVVLSWILGSLSQDFYLGHVFSDNDAIVWKELKETYDRIDGSIVFTLAELIDHGKLMRLMQFLMGLDDVYRPIRSSLLTRKILPEVRDAFLIVAREECHRGISSSSIKAEKPQASVFVARTNDNKRNNNNSNWNNGNSSFGNGNRGNYNLLCKNYGLKGHTIE
uniref:Ribonuclease H-like domain-containing protein n=1 Tax=Tanacetum cinerariifolium TaxID=118510 RepID=A0A6L2MNV5_TANCI|nr:ribonuclease H-like domain-containing protein [Tanacetum cinerariifolium]